MTAQHDTLEHHYRPAERAPSSPGDILILGHTSATLDQVIDGCHPSQHRLLPMRGLGVALDASFHPRADIAVVEDGDDESSRALTETVCRALPARGEVSFCVAVAATHCAQRERALLNAGADYYVAPFGGGRLGAYMDALMLRVAGRRERPLVLDPLVLDPTRRACLIDGESIPLTRVEFEILQQLALHAGHLVHVEELTRLLGATDSASSRARIRQHVYALRRKDPSLMTMIRTIRGCGYLLQS